LATGESFAGVSIEFEWLSVASLPGVQSFDVFDATTFDFIGEGLTVLNQIVQPTPVPSPSVFWTFALGFVMLRSAGFLKDIKFL
jgi:hypothetical protein